MIERHHQRPQGRASRKAAGNPVAINVIEWVWNHSRSKHDSRLVLLAIADNASSNGKEAWASVKEIMRKANCGERSVRTAIGTLEDLGELIVHRNAGPGGVNRYEVVMDAHGDGTGHSVTERDGSRGARGAESAPMQNQHPGGFSTPADSAPPPNGNPSGQASGPDPADFAPGAESAPQQDQHQGPAESADGTVHEPSFNPHPPHNPPGPEEGEGEPSPEEITAFVAEIRAMRPAWASRSIRRVMNDPSVRERGWARACRAMRAAAADPVSQQPGRVAFDGPWWYEQPATGDPRPPHCGACHERTRFVLDDNGLPSTQPCPVCHPSANRKAAS